MGRRKSGKDLWEVVGGGRARQRSRESRCRRQEHGKKKDELGRPEGRWGGGQEQGEGMDGH